MEFKRLKEHGTSSQTWIDKNLPKCPFCKSASLWETTTQVDDLARDRWHFRCPNCQAVFSTPADIAVSAVSPPVTVVKKAVMKNLRVESTGRSQVEGMVGKEYPLAEMQRWAEHEKRSYP